MRIRHILLALLWILPLALAAQDQKLLTLEQEPHHRHLLKNEVVDVLMEEIPPGETLLLHIHDHDEAAVHISASTTLNIVPGKPDQKGSSAYGVVHFNRSGRIHQTRNIGDTTLRTVSIGLLRPQGNARNLCAAAIGGQPLNCPNAHAPNPAAAFVLEPQFETDQTLAIVTHVRPKQSMRLGEPDRDELIVAIDDDFVASTTGTASEKLLHPGDLLWITRGKIFHTLKNNSDKEARYATFAFKP